jgi:catechol 2,3-dioxygenase-like lactoylglutathione lyase family enzyme
MLDHTSISVKDYQKSLEFYDQTLKALGYERLMTIDIPEYSVKSAGYGSDNKASFWISPYGLDSEEVGKAKGVHIAFMAKSAEAVSNWYDLCLKLGAKDNGAPGPRAHYHPGYFGAFVVDPNGWRIEAVFHGYQG